ncbi:MAG: hypothetical protein ACPH3N_00925 [Alcanivorax sediminis]|uniref:hypothetical protein n=1 Tax=Alcanivorax sediminis TaxID=2663008 RepID=UPI003C49A74B
MTDVIREAFEEWFEDKFDPDKELTLEDKDMCREAWQAALQSQTAPAVPEGWELRKVEAEETTISVHRKSDGKWCAGGQLGAYGRHGLLFEFFDAMLTATPSPDHSPDAGKVVGDHYDLGVALSRHFDELRDSQTGHIAFDPCDSNDIDEVLAIIGAHLSPTPAAESREEIQAQALETYAGQLDAVFARAQEAGADNCPAWHAGQFAKDVRKQAARLRASQQEGGDES